MNNKNFYFLRSWVNFFLKFYYSLVICVVFFCSAGVGSENGTSDRFIQSYTIGTSLINYRYTEPGLISHSGYLYGAFSQIAMKLNTIVVGLLDAEVAVGNVDYNGSLCDVNTNVCTDYDSKTNDFIFRTEYRFGFQVSNSLQVFAGPGIRYLYDRGIGSGFYTRIGTYFFLPVGMKINFEGLSGDFNLELEYNFFLSGMMQSKISEVNSTYSDVIHKQTNGSGIRSLLRYNCKTSGLFLNLAYEHWTVASSNVRPLLINGLNSGKSFVEPKNFTDAVSVGAGLRF